MTAPDDPVLRFDRFPSIQNRPQQDLDGRLWHLVRIEAPYCWAAPHGSDATATRYRLKVTRRRGGCYRLPLTTTEQRRLYNKMRKCGLDRAEALRVVMRAPADVRPLSSTF